MFCNVCSKEIFSPKFETIGDQIVCSLSCVGLLVSKEEDKCDNCQRPVWKDNYYIFNSKNYCSEKCKITAVKRYLKQNTSSTGVNIKHVQNEFFKNDSPLKNLQELRKEVKELYNDFEFEENCSTNNVPSTSTLEKNSISNLKTIKSIKKINEVNEPFYNNENINENENEPNPEPEQYNNNAINESVKKFNLIPHKVMSLKINKENNEFKGPRLLSRKKILKSYKRVRNNYSFDNRDKMLYNENDMENVKPMKYSVYNNHNNYSPLNINNRNNSIKKNMKLKPTVLRCHNNDKKLKNKLLIKIPNPHMPTINVKNLDRYNDTYINDENENYENIDYSNTNLNNYKNYRQFNTAMYFSKKPKKMNNNNYNELNREEDTDENDDNVINKRVVYICEPNYKLIRNKNFNN